MSTTTPLEQAAEEIHAFYMRDDSESTPELLTHLPTWIAPAQQSAETEQAGGNFQEERWRARRLRSLYEEGDIERVAHYGRKDINTMTGGWGLGERIAGGNSPFHNETTLNHLNQFSPTYIGNPYGEYASEVEQIAPFYQELIDEAKAIQERALDVRRDICTQEGFKQRIEEAARIARQRWSTRETAGAQREVYLLEEFNRRAEVNPLLSRVEKLYDKAIALTQAVIERTPTQ